MSSSNDNKLFEDLSHELYPERKNVSSNKMDINKSNTWWDLLTFKKNSADNFIKLRCQYKVAKALNESKFCLLFLI